MSFGNIPFSVCKKYSVIIIFFKQLMYIWTMQNDMIRKDICENEVVAVCAIEIVSFFVSFSDSVISNKIFPQKQNF